MITKEQALTALATLYKNNSFSCKELHIIEEYVLQLEVESLILKKQLDKFCEQLEKAISRQEESCG